MKSNSFTIRPPHIERFLLTSEEREMLLCFEAITSVQELSLALGRDHSVIARMLKRIASKFPVVEKKLGKWALTDLGRKVNQETKNSMGSLASILNSRSSLRIGTNREFAARVLAADLTRIQKLVPGSLITINTYIEGTESALLSGQVDIGIDCDRPMNPDISYKLVTDEPIVAVASKKFFQTYKKELLNRKYNEIPHLLCERLYPDRIFFKTENELRVSARFNDIAATRTACIDGIGWALLPRYSVAQELESKLLVQIGFDVTTKTKYGIWWPRSRKDIVPTAEKLIDWLKDKSL